MENKKEKFFGKFRFQLIPATTKIQKRIDGLFESYDDLVAKKNKILADIYTNQKFKLFYPRTKVVSKNIYDGTDLLLLRVGARKEELYHTESFDKEIIEKYPNLLVSLNNDPNEQLILVESNKEAFSSTKVVAKIIQNTFNQYLRQYQLIMYVEAIFEVHDFWSEVKKYENSIRGIDFELIKPNLSNIRGGFARDIQGIQETTNSHTMNINLRAPKKGILVDINENNEQIKDIVNYQSKGGGKPQLVVKNIRKKIKIGETVKEATINEAKLTYDNTESLVEFMKSITE